MSIPQAQIVELMKISVVEGEGRDEDDPVRNVNYFYQRDGVLLFRWDEWEEAQASKCSCTRCALRYGKVEQG